MPPLRKAGFMALAFLVLTLFGGAATARADSFTLVNGGPSISVNYLPAGWASSGASATFTLSGNVLTVQLTNVSTETGDGTRLAAFGFDSDPNITVANTTFSATGPASNWVMTNGGGGLGNIEVATSGGGNDTIGQCNLGPCATTLTFVLNGGFSGNLVIELSQVHLTSLGPGDGGSLKPEGNIHTPEPVTMLLLGTGLAGVAASARKRRKAAK